MIQTLRDSIVSAQVESTLGFVFRMICTVLKSKMGQKRNKPFVCGIRVKTHRIAFQWFKFHTFGFERQLIDWLVLKTEIVFSSGFGWICEIRTPPTILNWFPPNLLTNEVGCKDESRKKLYVPEPDSVGLQNFTKFRVFDLGQDCANVQLVDLKPEASKQRLSSRCWLSKSQSCYLDSLKLVHLNIK